MKRGSFPYVLALVMPGASIGLLWTMNMAMIPLLVKSFTSDERLIGLLISMGAFNGIIFQYVAGLISDRTHTKFGRRRPMMVIAGVLTVIFLLLMPFAPSYALCFIFSFLFYFFLTFYQGAYYALVPESVDDSILGFTNGISRIIGTLVAGSIFVGGPFLWQKWHAAPFLFAVIVLAVTTFITVMTIPEDMSIIKTQKKLSFDFFKFPSALRLFAIAFFVFLCLGCISSFFVLYCQKQLNIDEKASGLALMLLTLVGAAAAYPLGIASDKLGRRRILLATTIIFAAGLVGACFVHAGQIGMLYGVMSVLGVGYVGLQVSLACILPEIVPSERLGEFMGMYNLFISLPQFIGTNLMGFILKKFGYGFYFPVPLIAIAIAAVIVFTSKFERIQKA